MRQITEQYVTSIAPNPAAVKTPEKFQVQAALSVYAHLQTTLSIWGNVKEAEPPIT